MLNHKNILLGYSGHAYVVADAALKAGFCLGYYADKKQAVENPYNLEYLGSEKDVDFPGWSDEYAFILGTGDNNIRSKISEYVIQNGGLLQSVIHPDSSIAVHVSLARGTFVGARAVINARATVGGYAIINTGSIVEHECRIGKGSHIAPGAVLAGNVNVGDRTFVGANSVIKEGIKIGSDVIIGAGSTIINDIADGIKVVGNPGRKI